MRKKEKRSEDTGGYGDKGWGKEKKPPSHICMYVRVLYKTLTEQVAAL